MNLQRSIDTTLDMLDVMRNLQLIEPPRTGGYLTVLSVEDRPHSVPLLVVQIGELTTEKIIKYHAFSREKAARLALNYTEHRSSWQNRDPDRDQWGGAINTGRHILSFSGLPELADEALMLAVALELGLLSNQQAKQIADISDNQIFRQLVESQ